MSTSSAKFRRYSIFLACGMGLLVFGGRVAITNEDETSSNDLRTLLEERLDVMRDIEQKERQLNDVGSGDPTELYQARMGVLNARLDLAETRQEKATIYEEMINRAKEHRARIQRMVDVGGPTRPVDVLKAKANLLEIRIARQRAMMGTE